MAILRYFRAKAAGLSSPIGVSEEGMSPNPPARDVNVISSGISTCGLEAWEQEDCSLFFACSGAEPLVGHPVRASSFIGRKRRWGSLEFPVFLPSATALRLGALCALISLGSAPAGTHPQWRDRNQQPYRFALDRGVLRRNGRACAMMDVIR